MRHARLVYTAAALTAALGLKQQAAVGETLDGSADSLTVAATWRAQPSTIAQGGTTTFKLSLNASGNESAGAISFGQSTFTFSSGSGTSVPTSADVMLGATVASFGNTASAALAPLRVTYFEEGIHTATITATDAPISWVQDGVARTSAYSLQLGTTVQVGNAMPMLQSATVPILIGAGENFSFSALAYADPSGQAKYFWDFDSDGTFDSTDQNAQYAYATSGVHSGLLRVQSDAGSTDFQYAVDVLDASVVPLPAAVWGGLGLVSAIGMIRTRMALRRQGSM